MTSPARPLVPRTRPTPRVALGALLLGQALLTLTPAQQGGAGKPDTRPKAADRDRPAEQEAPWRRVLTGVDAKRVEELAAKVTELRQAGKNTEAQALARTILEICNRVQGEWHWQTAGARQLVRALGQIAALPPKAQDELGEATRLEGEASQLYQRGRYADAIPLQERILAIRRRHLGADHLDVAAATNDLAALFEGLGKPGEAEPLSRQVLATHRRVLGEDHPDTAADYTNLATILQARGRHAEAEPLLQKALAIHRRVLGEGHRDTAADYTSLANLLQARGRHAEAEPLLQKALAIDRRVLGEDHLDTAIGYNNLAHNLCAQGKFAEAEPLYRQALAIFREVLGDDHPSTARVYSNLAMGLHDRGRFAEAEPLLRKALAVRRLVLGEDHPDTATTYNNLALNLNAQFRHAEAEPLSRRVLAVRRRVLGEDHPGTARSYNNLATTLHARGRDPEAEPLNRESLAIQRRVLGEAHPDTAKSYHNLAVTLGAQGKYAAAETMHRQALAVRRRVLGEDHPDTAASYHNRAINLQDWGRYAEAELLLQEAVAIRRRVLGAGHPDTADSYNELAYTLHARGSYATAEEMWRAAAQGFEVARLGISAVALERAPFAAERSPLPGLTACLARAGKGCEAWDYLERNLARGLLDGWSERAARPPDPEEDGRLRELLGSLNRLNQQIGTLLSAKGVTTAGRAREQELQRRRSAVEAKLTELGAARATRHVYDRTRVQGQLPADAALLAWVAWKVHPQAADPNGEHWACLLRQSGPPVWVRLPGRGPGGTWTAADERLPGRLRQALRNRLSASQDEAHELARQLADQRLAPLSNSLQGGAGLPAARHLIVLPSPGMAGIPVEALTDRYTVSYAPSGTLFARLREKRQEALGRGRPPAPPRLLAVGDPVFRRPDAADKPAPPPPAQGALVTGVVPRSHAGRSGVRAGDVLLRYAGHEIAGPDDFLEARRRDGGSRPGGGSGPGLSVTLWREGQALELTARPDLAGAEVSRQSAAEALRAWREGEALLRQSEGPAPAPLPGTRREVTALARLFGRADTLLGPQASARRLDELAAAGRLRDYRYVHLATHAVLDRERYLQSALLLSQDQLPDRLQQALAGNEPEDGRLTAKHILESWQLDAELVTLSACQTALGRPGGGEGYLGFSQALFLAGAQSLVLSLWPVDDEATALLMVRFYQNLLGRRPGLGRPLPKALALAEAKRWLRGLSADEAERLSHGLAGAERVGTAQGPPRRAVRAARPYAHPHYWSAFILVGDPG
jgi:tetratricopeptide (TPR) repeat protein